MADKCDVCGTLLEPPRPEQAEHAMHYDCFHAFVHLKKTAVGYDVQPSTVMQVWGNMERMHAGALNQDGQTHYKRAAKVMRPALDRFHEGHHGSV